MSETTVTRERTATDAATRDLILTLADSKRLLGMRYAGWLLGAPELEAGIACASMAQDEWGHARLLYALLKAYGDDVDRLEHHREPGEYRSMEALDREPEDWPGLVALNALADTALTVQLESLAASSYAPLAQRVGKILEEERFHSAHGAAWFRRLAGSERARQALIRAVDGVLPGVLHWFGPADGTAALLRDAAVADGGADELRERFRERVAPLMDGIERRDLLDGIELDFSSFDAARRRRGAGGPDEATLARVRGDRNRAFLMD